MPRRDLDTVDMFEVPVAPAPIGGSLDYVAELCAILAEMITDAMRRGVIRSRYDLAARVSELTGEEVTKAMIDSWTAESKEAWRFPFQFAAAFESACDSHRLQDLLSRKRGTRILIGEDSLLAELGHIHKTRDELTQRERAIKKHMKARK